VRGSKWIGIAAAMALSAAALAAGIARGADDDPFAEFSPALGGQTGRPLESRDALTFPAGNLRKQHQRPFSFGNRLFNTNWVVAPASVGKFDGLGPLYNRVSCSGCHTHDGRGRPPLSDDEAMDSMLLRLSVADARSANGAGPHSVYGDQLSERAIADVVPEGVTRIRRETIAGKYGDGEAYELERPIYSIEKPGYGPFGEGLMISPRVAPQVIGLGLLEAVSEGDILARADPDDRDGDGITGRANRMTDPATGREALGRFGWKANQPSLLAKNAGAAFGDIGLTTPLERTENCSAAQVACAAAPTGGEIDLDQDFLDRLTLYTRLLAVPHQRDTQMPGVAAGRESFAAFGCAACHVPTMKTGAEVALPELANQTFHPFTDLLLHDMGEPLADNRPDHLASGREWRTPPLWGIGRFAEINGHTRYLHDGRARNLAEAILWHDGEALRAREAFRNASANERAALVEFLNSL
jgi:CxxC motif-containing protein (DUF1111 family)